MISKMFSLLANLKAQMEQRTFWCVALISILSGGIIGYKFNDFLTVRYREQKWESERQALETRIVSAESRVSKISNEKEQVTQKLEMMNGKIKGHEKFGNNTESLVISNQTLLAAAKSMEGTIDSLNSQIATLKTSLGILRDKYSIIPTSCTNSSLISVAYDLDEKMKLREEALARQTDELKAIMVDILAGLQKECQIQSARIKTLPLGVRQKEDADLASQFSTSIVFIGLFYSHFIKHIYQTADHIYYVNLLTTREVMSLKYKAPFQCVEVAKSLARKINAPDSQDQNIFKRASKIMENHLNGCK